MSKTTINYKAYSAKNHDFQYVYLEGRLRGCEVGNPVLVYGFDIKDSEDKLAACKQRYMEVGCAITNNRRGSFTVEVVDE